MSRHHGHTLSVRNGAAPTARAITRVVCSIFCTIVCTVVAPAGPVQAQRQQPETLPLPSSDRYLVITSPDCCSHSKLLWRISEALLRRSHHIFFVVSRADWACISMDERLHGATSGSTTYLSHKHLHVSLNCLNMHACDGGFGIFEGIACMHYPRFTWLFLGPPATCLYSFCPSLPWQSTPSDQSMSEHLQE